MDEILMFFGAMSAPQKTLTDWNMWMTFVTALAAIFTAWNAFEARRAVRISKDVLLMSKRPYLSFNGQTDTIVQPTNAFVRIPIKNVGQVPLTYLVKVVNVNGAALSIATYGKIGLFPGNEVIVSTPLFPVIQGTTASNFSFDVRIEFEYWNPESMKHYRLGRTFELRPNENAAWATYKDDLIE